MCFLRPLCIGLVGRMLETRADGCVDWTSGEGDSSGNHGRAGGDEEGAG